MRVRLSWGEPPRLDPPEAAPVSFSRPDFLRSPPFSEAAMPESNKQVTAEFLANRHQLLSFITGLLRDPQEAEDIFQEVWLKLAGALEKGIVIENQAKWCRKAAKHLVLEHWRSQRTAKVFADSTLVEFLDFVDQAYEESASRHDQRPERQRALQECVAALPARSKELIALKYDERLSLSGVAERAGQSTAAVIKALLRLRHALAACVERKLKLQELGL